MTEEKKFPDDKGKGDYALILARAGVSIIPFAGGPLEILLELFAPPLARRQGEWLESLANKLEELTHKVEDFQLEHLSENESFVSATVLGSRIVLTTTQKKKLEALQNACLNLALRKGPDEVLQTLFLKYVEELSDVHLIVLQTLFLKAQQELANPEDPNTEQNSGRAVIYGNDFLIAALPEYSGRPQLLNIILRDLHQRKLLEMFDEGNKYINFWMKDPEQLPKQFLEFISSPVLPAPPSQSNQ